MVKKDCCKTKAGYETLSSENGNRLRVKLWIERINDFCIHNIQGHQER